jgi:16S rRNA (guanine966-N2)-methyltransferase
MRIIAGKYGSRRLVSFHANHVRPTTDRIKEVIFNKLQSEIEGARVLDLFSGTGNLGIEALSRGAQEVIAVEKHPQSVQIIQKNRELLQISKEELQIIKKDVLSFLKGPFERGFDIVLIDPPFTEEMADEVLKAYSQSPLARFSAKIFIEAGRKEVLADQYGPLSLVDRKNYGDKFLSLYYVQPIPSNPSEPLKE